MDEHIRQLRGIRIALWVLVAVTAIAATAIFVFRPPERQTGVAEVLTNANVMDSFLQQLSQGLQQITNDTTGASFNLVSTKGGDFTLADLRGTPSLIFFGYTFCPDVCPTTMAETADWRQKTGIGYDKLRTIFITVDPERDTLDTLKTYLGAFDPNIEGLVGDAANTEKIKKAFGVVGRKAEGDNSEFYLVEHTASVFLIGADGQFKGTITYGEDAAAATAKIKRLVGG